MKRLVLISLFILLGGCQTSSLLDLLPVGQRLWQPTQSTPSSLSVNAMLAKVKESELVQEKTPPLATCTEHSTTLERFDIGVTELLLLEEFLKLSSQNTWHEVHVISNASSESRSIEQMRQKLKVAKFIQRAATKVLLKTADIEYNTLLITSKCEAPKKAGISS